MEKINLGQSNSNRAVVKGTGSYNGSLGFGFVQPTYFATLIPQAKLNLEVEQFVRLGSMPSASFGRVQLRNYVRKVDISEIWKPFESMLSKQIYTQGTSSFIPSSLPYVKPLNLGYYLLKHSLYSVWQKTSSQANYERVSSFSSTWGSHFTSKYGSFYSGICSSSLLRSNDATIYPDGADYIESYSESGKDILICFKWGRSAYNIKKIFDTIGYVHCNENSINQCVLPLCAYYKAWFDTFAPKTIGTQPNTWNNTACAKLLYYASNGNIVDIWADSTSRTWFLNMLDDLSNTYYYCDPDFITSHISLPSYSPAATSLEINEISSNQKTTLVNQSRVVSQSNAVPHMLVDTLNAGEEYGSISYQSKVAHDYLMKVTRWANANTFIGGKIDLYLKKYYGAEYVAKVESTLIGTFDTQIKISDVDATVNNELTTVGVPQGKGIGGSENNRFNITASTFCYVFVLSVAVPEGGYQQSPDISLRNLTPETMYSRLYDSLGYTLSDKSLLACDMITNENVISGNSVLVSPFGFRPRYLEYKTNALYRNVLSGIFRNHSTSSAFSSFYTNRKLELNSLKSTIVDSTHIKLDSLGWQVGFVPVANSQYASIGRFDWLGNFNRIFDDQYQLPFQNNEELHSYQFVDNDFILPSDNFILQQTNSVSVSAPWIPVSESWDIMQSDDDDSLTKIY